MLKNMSIKHKLLMMSVLPVAGLLAIMITALLELQVTVAGSERIYKDRVIPLEDLKVISDDYAIKVINSLNKANVGLTPLNTTVKDIIQAEQQIQLKWQDFMSSHLTEEEARIAAEAEALFKHADTVIYTLVGKLEKFQGNPENTLTEDIAGLYAAIDPISVKINELVEFQLRGAEQEFHLVQATYDESLLYLGLMTLVISASFLAIAFSIFHSLMGSLNQARQTIEKIALTSDLTLTLDITNNDELGDMAGSFNKMIDQMRSIIRQINLATGQLADSATDMTRVSIDANSNIDAQRIEIEQVATAMNEMVATAQDISQHATHADLDAQNTSKQAAKGNSIVSEAVNATNTLINDVATVSERIQALENDSASIGNIVDVIKEIAEQTNLLALNAAIEAARAGDQGRGFAVVADEVRTLAQRTQSSTQEIQNAIEHLQTGTANAVTAMIAGQEKAKDAGEKAGEAGEALRNISLAINSITDMNTQIASASGEQTSVSEEIDRSLISILDNSHSSAQGAQDIARSSEELSALADELKATVERFRIA